MKKAPEETKKWEDFILSLPEDSITVYTITVYRSYAIVRWEGDSFDLYREKHFFGQFHPIKKGVTAEEAANEIAKPF